MHKLSAICINFINILLRIMFERVWIVVGLVCEACDACNACDACDAYDVLVRPLSMAVVLSPSRAFGLVWSGQKFWCGPA